MLLFNLISRENINTILSSFSRVSTALYFSDNICNAGLRNSYSFQYSSLGTSSLFGISNAIETNSGQSVESKVSGTLVELCIDSGKKEAKISYQIFADAVNFGVQLQAGSVVQSPKRFLGEIYTVVENSGNIKNIFFPLNFSQEERNSFRDILINRTFVVPSESLKKEDTQQNAKQLVWNSIEQDPNGAFESEYVGQEFDKKQLSVKKTRLKYIEEKVSAHEVSVEKTVNPNSIAEFILNNSRNFTLMEMRNSIKSVLSVVLYANGQKIGAFETRYSEQLTKSEWAKDLAKSHTSNYHLAIAAAKKSDIRASDVNIELEKSIQMRELEGLTQGEVFALLENFSGNQQAQTKLFLKLKAILILYPHASTELALMMLNKTRSDKNFQLAALALVKTGHADAQNAYLNVLREYRPSNEEYKFLIALSGFIESPSEGIIAEVMEGAKSGENLETQSASRLALGNLGKALENGVLNSRAQEIEGILIDSLNSAQTNQSVVDSIDGLGNLGSNGAILFVGKYAKNTNARIRESAIFAMRYSKEDEVQAKIVDVAKFDSEMNVRSAAVRALGEQEISDASELQLVEQLVSEKSESVRMSLVDLLAKKDDRRHRLKPVFVSMLKSEPSPRVRAQVEIWLLQAQ